MEKTILNGRLRRLLAAAVLIAAMAGWASCAPPEALDDPIAERIEKGSIVVEAVAFVRAPQTDDPAHPQYTNDAHARIQSLQPIPDGSGRLALSDLRGLLYLTDAGGAAPRLYLDLRGHPVDFYNDAFPNESGLLGFAFHPQFGEEGAPGYGKLYTAFSAGPDSGVADYLDESGANQESVIYEWSARDAAADAFAGSWRELFRVGQFGRWHNIGSIGFNPYADESSSDYGLLYAGLGDGGGRNDPNDNGQNTRTPLGAIIRIDPLGGGQGRRYGIPADNPFASGEGGIPEIWAYGLRHPQHFSWDADGKMYLVDIGQDQVEEINIGVAGGNYGWRLREGMFATAFGAGGREAGAVYPRPLVERPFIYPVAQYDHDEGLAVGSGFVYRGERIPELQGKYIFADIVRGRVFFIETEDLAAGRPARIQEVRIRFDGEERSLTEVAGYPNTYRAAGSLRVDLRLGRDAAGELYLLTKGDGWVRRLVSSAGESSIFHSSRHMKGFPPMLTKSFGKLGWPVSAVGLGAWNIGNQWGEIDEATAWQTVRAAYDAGMTLFDVAESYGIPNGLSEIRVGRALSGIRHRVILVSKIGNWGQRAGCEIPKTGVDSIRICGHAILGRLGSDWVDVILCHKGDLADPTVYLEGFEALKDEGCLRAYGISTNDLEVLKRFNREGTCSVVQVDYSLLNQTAEEAFLPYCQEHGIAVMARGPLAKGLLSGRYGSDSVFTDLVRAEWNAGGSQQGQFRERVARVGRLGEVVSPGEAMVQAAIRYTFSHAAVSVSIPGAKSAAQARVNAAAGSRPLTGEEGARLREAVGG